MPDMNRNIVVYSQLAGRSGYPWRLIDLATFTELNGWAVVDGARTVASSRNRNPLASDTQYADRIQSGRDALVARGLSPDYLLELNNLPENNLPGLGRPTRGTWARRTWADVLNRDETAPF